MRRSDLFGALNSPSLAAEEEYGAHGFGYAGAGHQPQGRVLTAEEMYGALSSPSLSAEEEYGALGSTSLFAEEEYGDDDDDDDFGAWYGDDDDDDDDDFGFDDDDDFGFDDDDEYGDDDDDALDDLESDIDKDLYGAWYGAAEVKGALELDPMLKMHVGPLGRALSVGAFLPGQLRGGMVEGIAERVDAGMAPEAAEEIARYMLHDPRFKDWDDSMSPEIKSAIVRDAVRSALVPGVELQMDDRIEEQLREAWAASPGLLTAPLATAWQGLKAGTSNSLTNAYDVMTVDAPNIVQGLLISAPIIGNINAEAMKLAGINPADPFVNSLAARYWLANMIMGPQVYDWIVKSVDLQGASAIRAARASGVSDMGPLLTGPTSPIPTVQAPTQVIAPSPSGLPRPQTILAFGYATMCAGAALGVFD